MLTRDDCEYNYTSAIQDIILKNHTENHSLFLVKEMLSSGQVQTGWHAGMWWGRRKLKTGSFVVVISFLQGIACQTH
jgi:hypothetical protein